MITGEYQRLNLSRPSSVIFADWAYKIASKVYSANDHNTIDISTKETFDDEEPLYFSKRSVSQLSAEEKAGESEMPLVLDLRNRRLMNCGTLVMNDEMMLPFLFCLAPGIILKTQ